VQTSKSVTIVDQDKRPFEELRHHTTTYVSIPHGASSQVQVNWSEPCRVCVTSSGQEVVCHLAPEGKAVLPLNTLANPTVKVPLPELLRPLFHRHRIRQQRLYAFSVVIQANRPGFPVLSSYEFHVLCPLDFEAAKAVQLSLAKQPKAITPDLISDRAEGHRCSECNQVRKNLEKL
jgi:hypothetical protein